MARSNRDPLLLAVLALVTLVAGHNLVFLATFGAPRFGSALSSTGHGLPWTLAVMTTAVLATILAGLAAARVWRLGRRARLVGARPGSGGHGVVAHGRDLVGWWLVLFVVGLAAFALVENVERLVAGQHVPGLAAIAGSAVSPIAVFAAVSGVVAVVATLYRWRTARLLAEIVARQHRWDRSRRPAVTRAQEIDRRPESPIGRRIAGRAPPSLHFAPPPRV